MIDHIKTGFRILFLMIIISILYAYAMFQGAFVSWFLFYSLLFISIVEIASYFYPIRYWQVKRTVSNEVIRAGEDISVQLTVRRLIPFPIPYCIVEEVFSNSLTTYNRHLQSNLNDKKEKRHMKRLVHPLFKRTFTVKYTLDEVPRGEHKWVGIRIKTGSFFGLLKKNYLIQTKDSFVVYPNYFPIRWIEQSGLRMNEGNISPTYFSRNKSSIAPTVREFVPGDKITWIDWKQTARTTKLMTREFENEKKTEVLLALDYRYNEPLDLAAFESSIEYALSLFHYMEKGQIDIRFLAIGKKLTMFDSKLINSEQIENYLVRIKPSKSEGVIPHVVGEITKQKTPQLVLFVTTKIDQQFIEQLGKNVRYGSNIILFLIKSSNNQTEQEQINILDLQEKGVAIQVVTEKELSGIPVEVKLW